MRYMQMIKRCKLPLKKATSDVEAHGEEQAKRCSMSTADLKPPVPWEERLGHLRHSAVARLLVEGRLPADPPPPAPPVRPDPGTGAAMDLSKSSVLNKARNFHREDYRLKTESLDLIDATADRIRLQMGQEMENLKTRSSTNEVRFGGWKCRYCPYTANTSKKLYSHYQFHQQLLTSQSSKPHMEWLAAYRQAKDVSDGSSSPMAPAGTVTSSTNTTTPSPGAGENHPTTVNDVGPPAGLFPGGCFPPGLDDQERLQALRANGLSLRYLLGSNDRLAKQSGEAENSASGCLRSIVQAVMQQGSRSHASVTTTSVYASLVNGAAPKVDPTEPSCSVGGTGVGCSPKTGTPHLTETTSGNVYHREASTNGHTEYSIVKPEPRRPDVYNNEVRTSASFEAHVERTFHQRIVPYPLATVKSPELTCLESPPRRTVAVECQPLLTVVPERPASRESTSSFTSSASSEEINVDDSSPVTYDRRRMDSLNSEYSDNGIVRVAARKRTHSLESDIPCPLTRHQTLEGATTVESRYHQNQSCQAEELDVDTTAAKMLRLDHNVCDSHVKEEDKTTYLSPTAVISSTGTPPPTSGTESLSLREDHWKGGVRIETQESSVQCELLVPPSGDDWKNPQLLGPEAILSNLPDQSTNQDSTWFPRPGGSPVLIGSVKCPHCGIMFDDSVLHSIHMGCHSHSDPFICNVCGEQCSNKYGFYTHIMRGHHKH